MAIDKMTIIDYGADEFMVRPLNVDTIANKETMSLSESLRSVQNTGT